MISAEVAEFATSVRSIVVKNPTSDTWTPGSLACDHNAPLRAHLRDAGWYDMASADEHLEFVGSAAVELGRGLAPVSEVDALLGGSPLVSGLTRYAGPGDVALLPEQDGIREVRVVSAEAVPYGDGLGVCRASTSSGELLDAKEAARRERAWVTAGVGYLAGLASEALRMALDHTTSRQAFGGPLSNLDSVQQRLANAATTADGLVLLAQGSSGVAGLAYAGQASCGAIAECHQVVGAIGYTMEFPMQRYSRRARAVRAWADAWIDARD